MGKPLTRANPQVSLSLFNAAGLPVLTPWRLQDHNANDAAVKELNEAVLQAGAPAILKVVLDQLDPAAHLARTTSRALYALPYIISGVSHPLVHIFRLIKVLNSAVNEGRRSIDEGRSRALLEHTE